MTQSRADEVGRKLEAVARFLHERALDRILLQRRGPVGWLLAGVDTHVRMDSEDGIALVSVDRTGKAVLFTDVIEAPRLVAEELAGLPVEVVATPWADAREAAALDHARRNGARSVVAETPLGAVPALGAADAEAFRSLRYALCDAELARYRMLCHEAAIDLEAVTGNLEKGMTEHEAAADLALHVLQRGYRPNVVLVAFDERIERFRHPTPGTKKLERRAMVVLCAEHGGQVMAATRLAGFEPPRGELQKRLSAVVAIDAVINAATRPGVPVRDAFAQLVAEYERQGYGDEWLRHHQGGGIGYAPREYVATPESPHVVRASQAFAWNPSLAGVKCEDTLLVGQGGNEFLTATGNWPTVATAAGPRPTELLLQR